MRTREELLADLQDDDFDCTREIIAEALIDIRDILLENAYQAQVERERIKAREAANDERVKIENCIECPNRQKGDTCKKYKCQLDSSKLSEKPPFCEMTEWPERER